jgi:hypothetical protein
MVCVQTCRQLLSSGVNNRHTALFITHCKELAAICHLLAGTAERDLRGSYAAAAAVVVAAGTADLVELAACCTQKQVPACICC